MSLIKTLKFDDDVLEILKNLEWSEDGKSAKILQQLDRNIYQKVNKALEAMGGVWIRSAKAHVFQYDPRSEVVGLLETGTLAIEKDGFFETPPEVFAMMLDQIPIDPSLTELTYLEPSAGKGAIVKALIVCGVSPERIMAVEKNPFRLEEIKKSGTWAVNADFLTLKGLPCVDRIYMNPPFEMGQDLEHVQKAYSLLKPGGKLVSVMSESMRSNSQKKYVAFRKWLEEVEGRIRSLPPKSFHVSGTDVNTVLISISKEE